MLTFVLAVIKLKFSVLLDEDEECVSRLEDEDSDKSRSRAWDEILYGLCSCSSYSQLHSVSCLGALVPFQHSMEIRRDSS